LPVEPVEQGLSILGMGHFHPEAVIDNAFLESLNIGTDDAWIRERTGILERRTVLDLAYIRDTRNADPRAAGLASSHTNAQAGAAAACMAMDRAGIGASDVGLVIAGGCSPTHTIPAEAAMVANELGIQAPAYDIGSACSSFAAQLHNFSNMKPEAVPDYILVVNTENTTRTVDYNDRNNAVLWGDGSSAAILSPRKPGRFVIRYTTLHSDPSGWDKVTIPTGGHFMQNGSAVQKFAITRTGETIAELRTRIGDDQHWYIGHQANLLMLQSVCARADIAPEKHLYNVDRFGNCGAAGAPSVLSQNWDRFTPGDNIILVVVGSGLTWGGMVLGTL
jgi:3-oxoacyl-[acyl-carrier-protein] synthase III